MKKNETLTEEKNETKFKVIEAPKKSESRFQKIYEQEWNEIISKLMVGSVELPTVPKTNKKPIWFLATTDGDNVYIDNALQNAPSCNLKMQHKLGYNTFQKIYPIYLRRENGEQVSQEATSVTVHQVYYYSLIKHLCS